MPAQKRALPENSLGEEEEEDRHKEDFNRDVLQLITPIPKQICLDHIEAEEEDDDGEDEDEENEDDDEEEIDKAEDSDESPSSSPVLKPEFVLVGLPEIRKDVQCPICLGIIKKTRTVMECLHRFCRECIDKSMRMGNNECPACRTHCASRRSLRDDPNYDALIAILYPDIDKYEEEELAFHEEDQTRNKQIQASIAQIYQRQSEALIKRRMPGRERDSLETYMTRTQPNNRNSYLRRRSSGRTSEDNNEDGNANNDESSNDTEVRQRRRRRRRNNNRSSAESPSSERLAWGRGGARSHTRHGSWSSRNTRLSKLVDYLRNLEESIDGGLDVNLLLVSLDKQSTPSLEQPHLCCRASLSVKYICQYVARQTPLKAEEVEILVVKGQRLSEDDDHPGKDDVQILGADETLGAVKANFTSTRDHLILVYRRKNGGC